MKEYFRTRGYPDNLANNVLRKVSNARSTLLAPTPTSHNESTSNKVPLVLTYNPFNAGTRRIMLDNFNILSSDPEARRIFPEHPLVSHRRELNLGDILVHFSNASPSPQMPGHFPANGLDARRASKALRVHTTSVTILPVSLRILCIAYLVVAAIAYREDICLQTLFLLFKCSNL